jgi:hypothetical protein
MLELVSVKGDARRERQSSWLSSLCSVRGKLAGWPGVQLSFGLFVLVHLSAQAYRAGSDSALAEPSFEQTPGFVGALFFLLWLPFTAFGLRELGRSFRRGWTSTAAGQERALAVVEPLSLAIVLAFGAVHGWLMTWPLLDGSLAAADVRPELVAALSSTWRGLPARAIAYLCAVGAASFYAARLTLAALPAARLSQVRAVVGLAVLAYLLGSYAVIRYGTGSLLP